MNALDAAVTGTTDTGTRDYDRIAAAIAYLDSHASDQPDLAEVARAIGLSPYHFQRLFSRWAGISPKRYLGYLTAENAKRLLVTRHSVLDTALETGLSGPSRLHDLFVTYEAMTPGAYKRAGEGLLIRYGAALSPFGTALIFATEKGVCGLAFADPGGEEAAIADMTARWPAADFVRDDRWAAQLSRRIFTFGGGAKDGGGEDAGRGTRLSLHLLGTNFQVKVWEALLSIPPGRVTTYNEIASRVCDAKAARAVGTAVGRNPVSFLVPCHRVLRKSGALGGYHWGLGRKRAMLAWEAARAETLTG